MQRAVLAGLQELLNKDSYLLANNLSERSIAHKLAEYYQDRFPDLNVDCEFNRSLNKIKKISLNPRDILRSMSHKLSEGHALVPLYNYLYDKEIGPEELLYLRRELNNPVIEKDAAADILYFILKERGKKRRYKIFPDIIIHKRGTTENLAVFELKKSNNTNRYARIFDLLKIQALITMPEYSYVHGYFIDILVGRADSSYGKVKMRVTNSSFDSRIQEIYLL